MAVVSAPAAERIDLSPMDASPSRSHSDLASDSSSIAAIDTPDRGGVQANSSSPSPGRDSDAQSAIALRSEEYRQLFRLPPDEFLVQDFNCAVQESILIQGHLYVFLHHVCFYSNIFGYETKKIIPFYEITSVKRAKTAGIFPNAIEILAGGKKYFFGSFLSRDEALKLLEDGCLQHGNEALEITEQQESISRSNCQENEILIENVDSFKPVDELDSKIRPQDAASSNDRPLPDVENGDIIITHAQDDVPNDVEPISNADPSSSMKTWTWNVEDFDAPEIPQSYTRVAGSKFPIKIEEFFKLFFSDESITFGEAFHSKCGDKEFKCTLWNSHEKFGQARNVSFQHPIKIYFGAKFGSCQELQKFRVYRNSHLVIETSQQINDVPYGDYFTVEGLWDVARNGDGANEGCILRIYIDVAFSKRTVFKGKIVQSTIEECREAYALWIKMAHELLKQKNLEKQEEELPISNMIQVGEAHPQRESNASEASDRSRDAIDHTNIPEMSVSTHTEQRVGNYAATAISLLGEYLEKFCSFVKRRSQVSLILVVAFAVIFLMQVSIVVLLNRPAHVHVAYPGNYYMGGVGGGSGERSADTLAWLERRMHHLKDEMLTVEAWLERLQHDHSWLKAQLKDLDNLGKHKHK